MSEHEQRKKLKLFIVTASLLLCFAIACVVVTFSLIQQSYSDDVRTVDNGPKKEQNE